MRVFRFPILLCVFSLILSVAANSSGQTQLPADVAAQIDKLASDTLARTGVPSASVAIVKDGQVVYAKAYGDAKIEPKYRGHDPDALQHRLDQQTVYGGGDSAFAGAAEAFARRQSREIHSRSDTRERNHDSAAFVAHVWLSGLLAAGLRDEADARSDDGAEDHGCLGKEASRFRAGHEVAIQQHELCNRRRHCREGRAYAVLSISATEHFQAARHDERH